MRKSLLTLSGLAMLTILITSGVQKVDSNNGITGRTTSGCGSCHGSQTGTVSLTGLGTNVLPSKQYTFNLVYAPAASYKYFGLDLKCVSGTAGTGTTTAGVLAPGATMKLSGSEITHSSSMGGTATTSYTYTGIKWTSPAALGAVTFAYSVVAGSSTGTTSGPWQKGTFTTTVVSGAPVEFTAVKAAWMGDNKVTCSWSTATETNVDYFEVERSINNENSFKAINKVSAAGNGNKANSYAVSDVLTGSSVAYYRIKATDKDGKITYSEVSKVNIKPTKNYVKTLYPNPVVAGSMVNVQYVAVENGKVTVELYNALGRKLNTLTTDAVTGENDIKFNLGKFVTPGIYYVSISNGTERIAQLPVSVQ